MGNSVAAKFIVNCFDDLVKSNKINGKNILIFGATFKENCNDVRNSKSISRNAPILSGLFKDLPYQISKSEHGEVINLFCKDRSEKVERLVITRAYAEEKFSRSQYSKLKVA